MPSFRPQDLPDYPCISSGDSALFSSVTVEFFSGQRSVRVLRCMIRGKKMKEAKQARILVVDDSQAITDWFLKVLHENNFEAHSAKDGAEGIRLALSEDFDLIVSDVQMPSVDGVEFLTKLKDAKVKTRFVFLTGVATDLKDTVKFVKLGACDVLHKPILSEDLLCAVNRALALESALTLQSGPSQLTKDLIDQVERIEREQENIRKERIELDTERKNVKLFSILTRSLFLAVSISVTVLLYRLGIASGSSPMYVLPIVLFLLLSLPFDRIKTFVAKIMKSEGRATFK